MSAKRVTLPGTDLNVSRLCLGCWQFNGNKADANWEAQKEKTSKAVVDKCFEVGVNFFDTAEAYRNSEEILGRCLQGRRRDVIIATKFGGREGLNTPPYTPEQIDSAITQSLRRLQTDYIDILQMCYNILWRSMEHELAPICKENCVSILAYSPLQQGLLSGKFCSPDDVPLGRRRGKLFSNDSCSIARHGQPGAEIEVFQALEKMRNICQRANVTMSQASLAWLLHQDNVPCVIVGASSPEQVVENSDIPTLSDSVIRELTEATEPVKLKIGTTLDQWQHPDRYA